MLGQANAGETLAGRACDKKNGPAWSVELNRPAGRRHEAKTVGTADGAKVAKRSDRTTNHRSRGPVGPRMAANVVTRKPGDRKRATGACI